MASIKRAWKRQPVGIRVAIIGVAGMVLTAAMYVIGPEAIRYGRNFRALTVETLRFGHAFSVRLRQLKRNHLSGQTRARFRHRDSDPMGRQIPAAPVVIQQAHSQRVAAGSRHYSS